MDENRNNHFDEAQNEDYENRYNRFDGERESMNGQGMPRRRFVRVDSGNRQYSKVERRPRPEYQGGEQYQQRPRQYRPQSGGYGGVHERSYGQYGNGYGRDNRNYNHDGESAQPRFYRERVQGAENQGENGYQQRAYDGQRQFRPRQNGGYGQGNGGYRQDNGGYRQGNGGYRQNHPYGNGQPEQRRKPAAPKGKRIEYHESFHDPDEDIRLNKFLANAGVCSRREADDFIKAGVVKVNGQTVTELGCKIKRGDNVLFHDQLVSIERKIYILLNKPKDCVTTVDDPQERKTVMDYVKGACKERIYPVGRLDRNTTGVLLLTNDGEMATRLTHPKYLKKKIYHARLDRNVSGEDMEKLLTGVDIGDGDMVRADDAEYVNDDKTQVGIEIHSGRNRVVRRMFDALGYKVVRLDRVQFAGLTKKRLRRGDWRFLTDKEVSMLRMGAYE